MNSGQGLMILLSGPPGTGKTLTAEAGRSPLLQHSGLLTQSAVAENTRRPLYQLQAADLGSSILSIRYQLDTVFDLAIEWNAVVLVDGSYSLSSLGETR